MNEYTEIWYQSQDGLKLYCRNYTAQSETADVNQTTVVCLPGLTRNSADFHSLCLVLRKKYRVISVDFRGRGKSAWDPNPENYQPLTYAVDVEALIRSLNLKKVILLGTSLGGFVSLLIAANQPAYLSGLVFNDFAPSLEIEGLERIKSYVGKNRDLTISWAEALEQTKLNNSHGFPKLNNGEWLSFTKNLYRVNKDGNLELNYDPNIAIPFHSVDSQGVSVDLWPVFDSIASTPLMLIRGALSDLVTKETAQEMARRAPDMEYLEVPDSGHAPLLNDSQSIVAIEEFLTKLISFA